MASNLKVGAKVTHPSIRNAEGELIIMEVCEVIMFLTGAFYNEQTLPIGDVRCSYTDQHGIYHRSRLSESVLDAVDEGS